MLRHDQLRRRVRLVDIAMWCAVALLVGSLVWLVLSHRLVHAAEQPSRVLAVVQQVGEDWHVPPALRDTSEVEGRVVFTYVLNPARVELPYANAYLSNVVRLAGGEVSDGTDSGDRHRLLVHDPLTGGAWEVVLMLDTRRRYEAIKPQLAVIVDDFGTFNGEGLESFCQLTDPAVCFAVMPGEKHAREAMEQGAAAGHEILIHMPMEPVSYPRNNPGPNGIYVSMNPRDIRTRVKQYMNELPLAAGANNHMGSLATTDRTVMDAVLTELDAAGLYFVDSRTIASSVGYQMAQERGMRTTQRDIFLDEPDLKDVSLAKHITDIEKMLARHGQAVVITHCYPPAKLAHLRKFLTRVPDMGAQLVPVSALFAATVPPIP